MTEGVWAMAPIMLHTQMTHRKVRNASWQPGLGHFPGKATASSLLLETHVQPVRFWNGRNHRKVVISSRSVSGSERVSICVFWTHCFGAASEAGRQVGDGVGAAHGTHGRRLTVTVADAHGLRLLPGLQCPRDGDKAQGRDRPAT